MFSPFSPNNSATRALASLLLFSVTTLTFAFPLEALGVETTGSPQLQTSGGSGTTGIVGCTVQLAFTAISAIISGTNAGTAGTALSAIPSVLTNDTGARAQNTLSVTTLNSNWGLDLSNSYLSNFLGCLVRALARAALQQMAVSTINWINSGFNGSPSFVQNYDSFFRNVGDQAFGEILQGSDLAFLCTPFSTQVKIALAQSYASARRTPSCTITGITKNIQGFMTDFSQGGWPAFLSFTTTPTNNPFGSYMYSEAMISSRIATAKQNQLLDLQLGNGFLSVKMEKNCKNVVGAENLPDDRTGKKIKPMGSFIEDSSGIVSQQKGSYFDESLGQTVNYTKQTYMVCDEENTTPGGVISESLNQALGTEKDSLINAKYFDEIISALISQLVQNVLYNGLSTVSSGQGYGYNDYGQIDYSSLQNAVLSNLPTYSANAGQLETIYAQNAVDIQTSLGKANLLKACWNKWAGTGTTTATSISDTKRTEALANASSTQLTVDKLTAMLNENEQKLQHMKDSIDLMNSYATDMNSTSDYATMQQIVEEFSADMMSGSFPDTGIVNSEIENQVGLKSVLSSYDATSDTGLNQCNAFVPTTSN